MAFETHNLLRHWHEWASINIKRHFEYVSKSKLSTGSSSEAMNFARICQNHGVDITTWSMGQFEWFQSLQRYKWVRIKKLFFTYCDTSWNWLIWISVFICWETRSVWMTKLATSTSTPRVQVPIVQNCNCVGLATRNFLNFHLAKSHNKFWFRLVGASIFIFWHGRSIGMSKLATPTSSPRIKSSILSQGDCMSISTGNLDNFNCLE